MNRLLLRVATAAVLIASLAACSPLTPPERMTVRLDPVGDLGYEVDNSGAITVTTRALAFQSSAGSPAATITGAEVGKSIAILLDGFVYSAPTVNDRIDGGRSSITGNFTPQEAQDLENVLKSGKMQAGVRIVQEDVVGPSLGQEAINDGFISFIIALIVLFIFTIMLYGFIPGMVINAALLLNFFFTLGALAAFQAVLTLPGIAGMILSLAMAVDANVLINERIKEELAAGKTLRRALEDGYKNAFSAILDSNLTTIITGIILSVGRVISETAVFFVTLGGSHRLPTSIMDGGRTLALHLYYLAMDTNAFDKAMGTAAVLVTLIVLINLVIDIISRKLTAKVRGG